MFTVINSWGKTFKYENYDLPIVVELSYDNRKLVDLHELDNRDYHILGLDYSNNPNTCDIKLDYINR